MASPVEILQPSGRDQSPHREIRSHVHQVQFYETESYLANSVTDFLSPALKGGGSAVLVATPEHRAEVMNRLVKTGIPSYAILNRYLAVDARATLDALLRDGNPDPERFSKVIGELLDRAAASAQHRSFPIAAYGEMVALLWSEGKREAAVRLEQLWNDLYSTHSFSLLCAYPLSDFAREEDRHFFADICREHSSMVPAEGFTGLDDSDKKSRKIAELQQRAQALESEVLARATAEEQLRRSYAHLESLVEERTQALRRLSLHLLNLQDAERRRIARELHDSLGQDFVGLRMNLDLVRRSPYRAELWEQCDRVLEHCITEVRTLSYLLHPPMIEEVGFLSAAEWYIQDFTRRSGTRVNFEVMPDVGGVPSAAKLVLFRILQECLVNMHRHAHATLGCVKLGRAGENITLEVSDDGVGIPPEKLNRFNQTGAGMGVGLTGIWERVRDLGGAAELVSAAKGTLIRISVPFSKKSGMNRSSPSR